MNYIVVTQGHIALFDQHDMARAFAADFDGQVFNTWGLLEAAALAAPATPRLVAALKLLPRARP
jgi:hypothetical protein